MSGFTGTGAMGVGMEKPLGIVSKSLLPVSKKKKDRKTIVREAAQRVVQRLLNEK